MLREALETYKWLSVSEFKQKFQMKRTPVILSNALECSAMEKWSATYFKDKYSSRTVDLDFYSQTGLTENQEWSTQTLKLPDALDLICNNKDKRKKHYLMQKSIRDEFPEILSDVDLPKYADKDTDYFINLWVGESGIISQAHYDCSDNFLTQIVGRKRVRLFPPSDSNNMYPREINDYLLCDKTASHMSKIQNTDVVNVAEFPDFEQVSCFEGIISPGDLLFIPAGWWHEVKSLEMSISVNYWWKMQLFDLSDTQATNWICSTFFYFSESKFEESINTIFDFSCYRDDIEIAETALSKGLTCIAAVFLLHHFRKINSSCKEHDIFNIKNQLPEWEKFLDLARKSDNSLVSNMLILDIINACRSAHGDDVE